MMHKIYVNDQVHEIEESFSLQDLLQEQNYRDQAFAVAVNNNLVVRNAYKTTSLNAGDRVDIILPMQGG